MINAAILTFGIGVREALNYSTMGFRVEGSTKGCIFRGRGEGSS